MVTEVRGRGGGVSESIKPRYRMSTVLLALLIASNAFGQPSTPGIRGGAYAMNVNPPRYPISVNGGMSDRQATMANDPLHARCVALDDGKEKLVLVVIDSCMIPRELVDAAKAKVKAKLGIPPEQICISATHTHSAPTLAGVFQSDPDADYVRFLAEKIAEGIEKAVGRLEPAEVGFGSAQNPSQIFNRRWKVKPGSVLLKDPFDKGTDQVKMNPGYKHADLIENGPTDPEIAILSIRSRSGRPIAILTAYGLHYVGGNPQLSADYYGAYAERLTGLMGANDGFVAAMANGTSGDVNNVNFAGPAPGKREPGEQIRVVADSVARSVFEAYPKIKHRTDATLRSAQQELELKVRKPDAQEIARAKGILAKAKDPKKLVGLPEVYARETVLIADYPETVKLNVQAHRVGDVGIATIPCEVFTAIGLEIKQKSAVRPAFTIELANGYNGYLPTPEEHRLGGYETWRARSSYLEENASVAITRTILELMGRVANR
jgi:hypothetical protein